jgi:predicted metal-dependent phosphoesterase TrpH
MKSILQHKISPYDLHVHSLWSDGEDQLNDILEKAAEKGLKGFAICDHNAFPPNLNSLISLAKKHSIEIIKGIEISSQLEDCNGRMLSFHILGYYLSCDEQLIRKTLKETLAGYQRRGEKILVKCEKLGLPLDYEQIRKSNRSLYISRNTIAEAISNVTGIDFRASLKIAFLEDKEDWLLDTFQAISLIKESGGIPILAHAAKHIEFILKKEPESILNKMIDRGLRGIEVFHPSHKECDVAKLYKLAKNHGLLMTGGTDYHGNNRPPFTSLGDLGISKKYFNELEKALRYLEKQKWIQIDNSKQSSANNPIGL